MNKKSTNANMSRATIMAHASEKWTRTISVNAFMVLLGKIVLRILMNV